MSTAPLSDASALPLVRLGDGAKGLRGTIVRVDLDAEAEPGAISAGELERRLLEMGFVEGAKVTLLHHGLFGRDPLAVQLDDMKVALRRREARGVWIQPA